MSNPYDRPLKWGIEGATSGPGKSWNRDDPGPVLHVADRVQVLWTLETKKGERRVVSVC
jgi:hypothetical protein